MITNNKLDHLMIRGREKRRSKYKSFMGYNRTHGRKEGIP